jgi:putative acetyltransferase
VNIQLATSPRDVATVQQLWREYWGSLGLPTEFQNFGEELQTLPGVYGKEGGVLLLARQEDQAAGTIAMRRLDLGSGEVKRLYLRPQFRGQGLGRALVEALIESARAAQYQCLYADTLPTMMHALKLYKNCGFQYTVPYCNTPTPGAIYLKLELVSSTV